MRTRIAALVILALAGTGWAFADNDRGRGVSERLFGYKEVPNPLSTTGNGTFRAWIDEDDMKIHYQLTFKDLEGDVTQAHIHIGHPNTTGGIVLWLCETVTNQSPNDDTPDCTENDPAVKTAGRVRGTLTEAHVRAVVANDIAAGAFAEAVALIKAGKTYANVHSSKFGPGEIRAQIDDEDDDDDRDRGRGHGGHDDH
jgi:hypothetical protein